MKIVTKTATVLIFSSYFSLLFFQVLVQCDLMKNLYSSVHSNGKCDKYLSEVNLKNLTFSSEFSLQNERFKDIVLMFLSKDKVQISSINSVIFND